MDKVDTPEFVDLTVNGTMNTVKVIYGKQNRDVVNVSGTMSETTIHAERVNVSVKGTMNEIKIDPKVSYIPVKVVGTMNEVRVS